MHHIERKFPVKIAGSQELYLAVRASLVARGTSLNAWCKQNDLDRQTVEKALKGLRFSRRSQELRDRLIAEVLDGALA